MIIWILIWECDTPVILADLLGGNLLVLVDQHAAHERIRLEQLIIGKDLNGTRKDVGQHSRISIPERVFPTVTCEERWIKCLKN